LLVLSEGMVHGRAVPLLPGHAQRGFDHRAEHQPVGERRPDAARPLERADHIVLRLTIESLPQLAGRAHNRVREERRVDQRLSAAGEVRSEEHTSELQSRENLVCRLLLEKKKKTKRKKENKT